MYPIPEVGLGRIGVDNTVSVVSTEPFKEIKKIQVGYNPGRIRAGQLRPRLCGNTR